MSIEPARAHRLRIVVERTVDAAKLPTVTDWEPRTDRCLLGRGSHCDLVLPDNSVGVEHLMLDLAPDSFTARALTASGTTLVEGRAVELGEQVTVSKLPALLQIGRYRVTIDPLQPTERVQFSQSLVYSESAPATGWLTLVKTNDHIAATVGGVSLEVSAAPLRALWLLADCPGRTVTRDELVFAVSRPGQPVEELCDFSGGSIDQAISKLRRAIQKVLEETLQADPTAQEASAIATKAGAQGLIATERGLGYRLVLASSLVRLVRQAKRHPYIRI